MKMLINKNEIDLSTFSVRRAVYYDYIGGRCDKATIVFDYNGFLSLKKGDQIEISSGSIGSGALYVSSIAKRGDTYDITALSTRPMSGDREILIKNKITLYELAYYVGVKIGCDVRFWHVDNQFYEYKEQIREKTLSFFAKICELEGIVIKIKDNVMTLINEEMAEKAEISAELADSDFKSHPAFFASEVGLLRSVYNSYNSSDKVFRYKEEADVDGESITVSYPCGSIGECQRICKNLIRKANKSEYTGSGVLQESSLAAGNTIQISGQGIFSGKYLISIVENDLLNDAQRISFYKISGGAK